MVQKRHLQHSEQYLQKAGLQHLLLQQRHYQGKQLPLVLQYLQFLLQQPQFSTVYYHATREYYRRHQTFYEQYRQQQHAQTFSQFR